MMIRGADKNARRQVLDGGAARHNTRTVLMLRRSWLIGLSVVALAAPPASRGNIVITMATSLDEAGNNPVSGPVDPGTQIFIRVKLAVDANDDPLQNVRQIQFDLTQTGAGLNVTAFDWRLNEAGIDDQLYELEEEPPDNVRANYGAQQRVEGNILDLTQTPATVALITATVNAAGSLDLLGPEGVVNPDDGIRIQSGFGNELTDFNRQKGNIDGGTQQYTVNQPPPPPPPPPPGDPVLRSISVTPTTFMLEEVGSTRQLVVTGRFSDGSAKDLTAAASGTTYSTSDAAVLTVSVDGLVTAAGEGDATITARNGAFSADAQGTVSVSQSQPTLESIRVTPGTFTINTEGGRQQLTVTGLLSNGESVDLTLGSTGTRYATSDQNVATVSADGVVTEAGTNGSARITATNGEASADANVTVDVDRGAEPQPCPDGEVVLDRIEFTIGDVEIDEGQSLQLTVRGVDCNGEVVDGIEGSDESTFESSDETVATVDDDGLLEALADGEVDITVRVGSLSDQIHVTVLPVEEGPGQGNENDNAAPNDNGGDNENDNTGGRTNGCGPCAAFGMVDMMLLGLGLCGLKYGRLRARAGRRREG